MNLRKLILLMLPVSVAFIIGGKSGTLLDIHEFQWPAAIAWGTVIAIIDYNFSIIKKMGTLAIVGRIVLVLSSAAVTATIGDHIIFKDTIENIKRENAAAATITNGENPEIVKLTLIRNKRQVAYDELSSEYVRINKEVEIETNNGGCKGKCAEKKVNRNIIGESKADAKFDLAKAEDSLNKFADKLANDVTNTASGNDLITEIQDLYAYIFDVEKRGYGGAIMFSIFVMMTICIETLPLMLKSGLTEDDVKRENKKNGEDKRNEDFQNTQTILRNNAY